MDGAEGAVAEGATLRGGGGEVEGIVAELLVLISFCFVFWL